jgi:hypothetical protein
MCEGCARLPLEGLGERWEVLRLCGKDGFGSDEKNQDADDA